MTAATSGRSATRELLTALMSVKTWFRETQQGVYDGHSATSLMALALLERHGPARVTELAASARVDASVVSRQAAHLEQAGLVGRTPDPADGRAHRLVITPEGTAVLARGRQRLVALVSERLHDWPDDEIERFASTLRRLLTDLTTSHENNEERLS